MDQSILPSKQFIVTLLIVTVVLGGGVAVFLSTRESKDVFGLNPTKDAQRIVAAITEADKDEDGLRDWEESLWSTDINNPDTDGDGTKDGEEVATNRDPITAGPNDIMTKEVVALRATEALENAEDLNQSMTAQFARTFFIEFARAKEIGKPTELLAVNEYELEKMIPRDPFIDREDIFTVNDLIIVPSTTVSLREYGNAAGRVQLQYPTPNEEAITIFYRLAQGGNKKDADKLAEYAKVVSGVTEGFLGVSVPDDLASEHARLMNSLSALSEIISSFQNASTDPLYATASSVHYFEVMQKIARSNTIIAKYLKDKGVTFKSSEPGYVFENIYGVYKQDPSKFI